MLHVVAMLEELVGGLVLSSLVAASLGCVPRLTTGQRAYCTRACHILSLLTGKRKVRTPTNICVTPSLSNHLIDQDFKGHTVNLRQN